MGFVGRLNGGHRPPQTVEKTQGERERAEALSHFNRTRRRVRRGRAIFPAENLIFQRKNRFPAVSAPGNPLGFQRRLEGVVVAGERLPRPPACQKVFWDKLRRRNAHGVSPAQVFVLSFREPMPCLREKARALPTRPADDGTDSFPVRAEPSNP